MTGGVTFVVRNGQILQQVTADVSGMQVVISGTALTLGVAPVVGELLWGFVSTSLSVGLAPMVLFGVQNGTNTSFVLASTVPANSHLLFFQNGQVLEDVVAGPTGNQFSVSGTTLTLGIAPASTAVLQAFVEVAATAFFRVLQLTAISTSQYTISFTPPAGQSAVYLGLLNGLALDEVTVPPVPSEFRITRSGTTLELGGPASSTDVVALYLLGLTTGIPLAPSLPTYLDMQNELIVLMNAQIDLEEAKMCLARRWQKMWSGWPWSFVKQDKVLATTLPKNAGTVSVTQGSVLLSGTGTSFATSDVGAYLAVGEEFYRVADVIVISATVQILMLETPYREATNTASTYTLSYVDYALDIDTMDVVVMSMPDWPLEEISQAFLNRVDAGRYVAGPPTQFARKGLIGDHFQIELWPFPDARYTIRYVAVQRNLLTSSGQFLPDMAGALLLTAKEMACGVVASKRAAEQDYEGGVFWLGKAQEAMVGYQDAIRTLRLRDRRRFGQNTAPYSRQVRVYADDPRYDLIRK